MNHHLTTEQLNDLLLSGSGTANAAHNIAPTSQTARHLAQCPACTQELATLRAALANFRTAASAFAQQEALAPRPIPAAHTSRLTTMRAPLAWAAAAVVVIGAVLPTSLHYSRRPHPVAPVVRTSAPQSDEALLEEIDQDLSAPVPSAMQPLNDPTGSLNNSTTQRKSK